MQSSERGTFALLNESYNTNCLLQNRDNLNKTPSAISPNLFNFTGESLLAACHVILEFLFLYILGFEKSRERRGRMVNGCLDLIDLCKTRMYNMYKMDIMEVLYA